MNLFKITEVIDIGIEKEKKRKEFYALAAESFSNKEIKDLFIKLRDWEDAHIKRFTEIKNEVGKDETIESYPGELTSFMEGLIDNKLYSEVTPENFGKTIKTPIDAITRGIGFEKDAILLFLELLSYISTKNKQSIETLINEERMHIRYLNDLKKKITV